MHWALNSGHRIGYVQVSILVKVAHGDKTFEVPSAQVDYLLYRKVTCAIAEIGGKEVAGVITGQRARYNHVWLSVVVKVASLDCSWKRIDREGACLPESA